jgi:hypothetical protein
MSKHKDALGAFVAKIYMHFLFLPKFFPLAEKIIGAIGLGLGFAFGSSQPATGNFSTHFSPSRRSNNLNMVGQVLIMDVL